MFSFTGIIRTTSWRSLGIAVRRDIGSKMDKKRPRILFSGHRLQALDFQHDRHLVSFGAIPAIVNTHYS